MNTQQYIDRNKAPVTARLTVFERPEYKMPRELAAAKARLAGLPRPVSMGVPDWMWSR